MKKQTSIRNLLFLVCSLSLTGLVETIYAQQPQPGVVSGTVVDVGGAVVKGAKVSIKNTADLDRTVNTGTDERFR